MIAGLKRLMLAATLVASMAGAAAAVQTQVMVQGYLTNSSGTPYTTPQTAEFRVYQGGNATTAGSGVLYYDETATVSPTASGVFNYALGSGSPTSSFLIVSGGVTIPNALTPATFDTTQPVYLEISVGGFALLPRLQLLGNPYAAIAGLAENVKPTQQLTTVALNASSATLTATGANQFSLTTSSGINVQAGVVTAPAFNGTYYGDGSKLTGVGAASVAAGSVAPGVLGTGVQLPAGSLVGGPVAASILPSTVAYTSAANTFGPAQAFNGGLSASTVTATAAVLTATGTQYSLTTSSGISVQTGMVTAPAFSGTYYGDGSKLSGVGAASVAAGNVAPGLLASGVQLAAGSLVNGPLASAVLPSTVAYTSSPNTFTAPQALPAGLSASTITASAGSFTASGAAQFSLTTSSGINVQAGMVTAPAFAGTYYGDGSKLSGVGAASVAAGNVAPGLLASGVQLAAGSLTGGPVASSVLPSTVAYTSSPNTFTAPQSFAAGVTGSSAKLSGGVVASSAALTAAGNDQFSLTTSSGINVQAGMVSAPAFAGTYYGDGSKLTGVGAASVAAASVTPGLLGAGVQLPAGSLTGGPVASSILPSTVAYTSSPNTFSAPQSFPAGVTGSSAALTATGNSQYSLTTSSGISVQAGTVSAPAFAGTYYGDGSKLTGVGAASVAAASVTPGLLGAGVQLPAGSLVAGPIASSVLPSTVAYTSSPNSFTAAQAFAGGLTASSLEVDSPADSLTILGGVYSGPTSGYSGVGQITSRHALAFRSWSNVAPDTLGVKIEAVNKTAYPTAPWYLAQTSELHLSILKTGALTKDDTFDEVQITPTGLNAVDGLATPKAITAANASLTATGNTQYSLNTSSGINVQAGMVSAPAFAGAFIGDGSALTGVAAADVAAANISPGVLPAGVQVPAANVTPGALSQGVQLPAGSLVAGPVASSVLPSTVAYTSSPNTFSAPQAFAAGLTGTSAALSGGVAATSATLTASGNGQYSLTTSSGISVQAGMVSAPAFAGAFVGDGSALTGVAAAHVAAGSIVGGPVAAAVLPSTVAYTSSLNNFTAPQTFGAGLSATSATLTATGNAQYSLSTSSGINVQAGTVTAPAFSGVYYGDGSRLSGLPQGVPIGGMIMWPATSEPAGWIEADGRSLPQNGTASASWGTFNTAALFAVYSTVWGSAGAGAFNIPDFRGMVPRGYNHGKTGTWSDPDAASRVAQYPSGAAGDAVGSYQKDQLPDHTHNLNVSSFGAGTSNWATIGNIVNSSPTGGINTITGSETRAKNASVMFLVRVQ